MTTTYSANTLSQYSAVGTVTPTYDGNGNLTYDGSFTYCYDAESRLTGIVQGTCASPTSTVASYAYDAQGRRKLKTVTVSGTTTTTIFVTDADNREVLEYDGTSGAIQNWYSYGLGPDNVLNRMNVTANTRQTLIPDVQGSIQAVLGSSTGVLTKIGYQTYGENPGLNSGNFRYTARCFDPETAGSIHEPSGLYYYRARMYSPTLGRFMQPDPIGYSGGGNLYAYVGNDPLNNTDPSGNCIQCAGFAVGAVIGLGTQALTDLITGQESSFATYTGAAVGGGVSGATLLTTFNPVLSGLAGGAAANLTTQSINNISNIVNGQPPTFSAGSFLTTTAIGGIAGSVGLAPGVSSQFSALAQQVITKIENETISQISLATFAKVVLGQIGEANVIPAAVIAAGLTAEAQNLNIGK